MARQFRRRETSTVSGLAGSLLPLWREANVYGDRRLASTLENLYFRSTIRFNGQSRETLPGPAIASHANSAKHSVSSKPSKVSRESTWSHLAEMIATIIVTPKAPAEMRVKRPSKRKIPPKNSTPETKGANR